MSKRVKGKKMCPEDYDDAEESDSDICKDPDYLLQERPSPNLSQDNGCATYKTRLRPRTKNSEATANSTQGGESAPVTPLSGTSDAGKRKRAPQNKRQATRAARADLIAEVAEIEEPIQANRDRISSTSHDEEDDERERRIPKKKPRKTPSIIWKHVTKLIKDQLILCNYCDRKWNAAFGSTSNPLHHLRKKHYDQLNEKEISLLPQNGATSGTKGVRRTLYKQIYEHGALPRTHPDVQETDRKVAKVILTSLASWSLLDNEPFGSLCAELVGGRYNLPSRYYIQENVMTPMYKETKQHIIHELQKHQNIGLTTDAWTSTTQQSYITVTAHIIDENCKLKAYVLDTTEITKRHTSENLMEHIETILIEYEIKHENEHNIILNFNATNPADVHEEDQEQEHEVDYLNDDTEFDNDDSELTQSTTIHEDNVIDSQSLTQELLSMLPENTNENVSLSNNSSRRNSIQSSDNAQCPTPTSRPSTPHKQLHFVSDNASDITKALSRIGGYQHFGCAGHHLNLVAQAGFKLVQAAANLVKRCKKVVEHIKSSGPATYLLVQYQKELEMPLLKVLQQNNTRWWSILLMLDRMLANWDSVTLTLADNKKSALLLTDDDQDNMRAIVKLLEPFKECGEALSSENNVTISLIVPHFNKLRKHLSPCATDKPLIQQMKSKMLIKLNDRYTEQQLQRMTVATLLDVRFKNLFKDQVEQLKLLLLSNRDSQNENPATEGQQLENLSASSSTKTKSIFAYDDDEDAQVLSEPECILAELRKYKKVRFSASDKAKINVLKWWHENQTQYPHLFTLVKSHLHIPATSVPSERIFSIAGYIVRDRRSRMLSKNVNKAIFLKRNVKHIPRATTVFSPGS